MITDNSVSDVAHEHPVNEDLMTTDPPKQCTCFEILHSGQHTRRGESRPLLGCDHPDCPYRYLQRDTFTSEAFKIQVKNVHRYTGFKQLKKLLDTLNVKYRKVKLLKDVTFITLSSVEDRDAAVTVLNGHVWRGQTLEAKIAAGRADPLLEKKHRAFDEPEGTDAKRLRICEEIFDGTDPADLLRDTVTPLWRLPYDPDQIAEKRSALLTTLAIMRSRLIGCNWSIESLLCDIDSVERDSSNNACVCPLLDTIRSPIITNYRNKSELTIGRDLDGRGPVIGFRFSKYRDGLTAVGCFHGCTILPRATMDMLDHLQKFLDSYISACPVSETTMDPPLDTLDPTTHQGHWRQVVSRESRNGDRLLLVDIHPQNLSKDEIQRVSDRLTRWFTDCDKPKVTSLFLATRTRTSESFDATNTKLLWGKDHIVERCCDLNFRVSPTAFFQVNTLAAELLYEEIAKFASGAYDNLVPKLKFTEAKATVADHGAICQTRGDTILLDVCCGTGTIALCLAKHFDRVIGIELVASAVEDAKHNAELNGITNASFHCGPADKVLNNLINTLPSDSTVVAVVDPPRSGLHAAVVQCLRRCVRLQRIIFVSCNLEAAMQDFIDFVRPTSNRFQGAPFVPLLAKPVDLFPQTRHIEVILLLQRVCGGKQDQIVQ